MLDIFCKNNHLVLDQDRCQVCGWTRPVASGGGEPVWEGVRLPGQIGSTGVVRPAACGEVVVFPLRDRSLVGLDVRDGGLRWESPVEPGRIIQGIRPDGNRFLCAISDARLTASEANAQLAFVDPETGEQTVWWHADARLVSDFTLQGNAVYLSTGKPVLLALAKSDPPVVQWEYPLESWSPIAPVRVGDQVMVLDADMSTGNSGNIRFVNAASGVGRDHPYRTSVVQMRPVTVINGTAFFQNGGRRFAALNPALDAPVWERQFEHFYTSPAAGSGNIYLVVRWRPPGGGHHEYRLTALDAGSGETTWETAITERTTMPPVFHRNMVVIGTQKGSLLAFDALSGSPLWQYRFEGDQDPIQTSLLVDRGILYAGTRSGQVAAVSLGLEPEAPGDPEELVEAGRYEEAAAVYALEGAFAAAAALYNEKLRSPEKALDLLEHGGLHQEAGELAQKLQLNTLARDYFHKAGDVHREAITLIRMGNLLKAAQLMEEIGELEQAATLYEKAQEPRKALEIYKRLSRPADVDRLTPLVTITDADISYFEQAGRLEDAARIAEENGRLHTAFDLYSRAQDVSQEYRVLQALVEKKPEEWSLELLGQLAASFQDHLVAAKAWDQLERPHRAAPAYRAAAEQAEKEQSDRPEAVAALYELAMKRYGEAGLHKEYEKSYEKIIQLRRLPNIIVQARMDDKFRENEFNEVTLEIENTGPGLAKDVNIEIGGDHFEVDRATGAPSITTLAGMTTANLHRTYLRPKPHQIGRIPLSLSWTWKDRKGTPYDNQSSVTVEVRRQEDSGISRPGEIKIETKSMANSQVLAGSNLPTPTPDALQRLMAAQTPLKILFLAANPTNLTRLSIDQELRLIRTEVFDEHPDKVDLEYRGAIRVGDLQKLLLRENPDIVHFSGHGSPSGAIYVEEDSGGSHPLESSDLSNLFHILKGNIRLVVLNACYSEIQAAAIAEHIDCVIGMSSEIDDEAARSFSKALYLGICYNLSLETAFNMGCNEIAMQNLEDVQAPRIIANRTPASEIKFFRN